MRNGSRPRRIFVPPLEILIGSVEEVDHLIAHFEVQALGNLDPRSADVVRRRYGLMDGRQAKLADIASVWGITAERVRQIERQAIAKLRTTQIAA